MTSAICTKTYHVALADVDFTCKLKLSALFNYFQDAASDAAASLGVGMNLLEQEGIAWFLIRMRVEVIRYPELGEDITIETWPQHPGKLEFERDFLVFDRDKEIIARAISSWVLIDIEKRRLRRSDSITLDFEAVERDRAINSARGKLQAPPELDVAYKRVIGYSDIDVNGHLNNTKFVDFILDCFTIGEHAVHQVRSLEIAFVNEALPGDTVVVHKDPAPAGSLVRYIEGTSEQSGKVAFRSQVELAPKA